MDGIFYSKDNIINNFEYWQKYDPFKRIYENIFFKTCVKKGHTTYLKPVFPSKDFMENTELLESTELVVCKLRVQKILLDKTKTNKAKALEIIELLSSYPLASILTDVEEHFDNTTANTYLISEFVDDMQTIIKGLDKTLYNNIFTEEDAIISLIKYCENKSQERENNVV